MERCICCSLVGGEAAPLLAVKHGSRELRIHEKCMKQLIASAPHEPPAKKEKKHHADK